MKDGARESRPHRNLLTSCLLVLLFLASAVSVSGFVGFPADDNGEYSSARSWAIGVVVPEGTRFADEGPALSWEHVRNVTAVVRLPNVTHTDGAILAVLSVMTQDEHVLQVAAGIYPNYTWLVYSWVIDDIQSYPQKYDWILNSSKPQMSPGALVALSIFLTAGDLWHLGVLDVNENASVQHEFPRDVTRSIKAGDQEVFALESYTSNPSIFEHMGNLSLQSILVDGRPVSRGTYSYSVWDHIHNPLFVVGGADPPPFLSVELSEEGAFIWSYSGRWTGSGFTPTIEVTVLAYALLLIGGILIVSVIYLRNRESKPS